MTDEIKIKMQFSLGFENRVAEVTVPVVKRMGEWIIHPQVLWGTQKGFAESAFDITHVPSGLGFPHHNDGGWGWPLPDAETILAEMSAGPKWDGDGDPPEELIQHGSKVLKQVGK